MCHNSLVRQGILTAALLVLFSASAFAGWNSLASGTTQELKAVFFPTTTVGYAGGGDGTVIKTTTSGTTFEVSLPFTTIINDLVFPSANEGWGAGEGGKFKRTTDAGANWNVITPEASLASASLRKGSFNGARRVFAAYTGLASYLYSSTDSGANYSAAALPAGYEIYGVVLTDDATWEWGVSSGTYLIRKNGSTVFSGGTKINDLFFVDSNTGFAVGNSGSILKTTSGGNSASEWSTQSSGVTVNLNSVYFISSSIGWAVGDSGTILFTSNGGATWLAYSDASLDTTKNLNDIYVRTEGSGSSLVVHAFAVGAGGKVYKLASPSVTSVSPVSRQQGWIGTLEVTGTGFMTGAVPQFSGSGITIISSSVESNTSAKIIVMIDSAATAGARNLTLTNPDLTTVTSSSAFTVDTNTNKVSISNLWLDGNKYLAPASPPRTTITPTPQISLEVTSTTGAIAVNSGAIVIGTDAGSRIFFIPSSAVTSVGTNSASVSHTITETLSSGQASIWLSFLDAAGNVGSTLLSVYVGSTTPRTDVTPEPGVDRPGEVASAIPRQTKWNPETQPEVDVQVRVNPGSYLPRGVKLILMGPMGQVVYQKEFEDEITAKKNIKISKADLAHAKLHAGIYLVILSDRATGQMISRSKIQIVPW